MTYAIGDDVSMGDLLDKGVENPISDIDGDFVEDDPTKVIYDN